MPTYKYITGATVSGSSTNTVTFDNIPQTYNDLIILASGANSVNQDWCGFKIANSTSNLSGSGMQWNTTTISGAADFGSLDYAIPTINPSYSGGSSQFGNVLIYINSYSSTSVNKSIMVDGGYCPNTNATVIVNRNINYQSTSAISRIDFYFVNYVFIAGSNFNLYGISRA